MFNIEDLEENYVYDMRLNKDYVLNLKESKETEKYSIVSDAMFKAMMIDNKRNTSYFLACLFKVPYDELYNNIQDYNKLQDKTESCSLVVKLGDDEFTIEINQNHNTQELKRNINHALSFSAYNNQRMISININNFAFAGNNNVLEQSMFQNDEGIVLTNKFRTIQIYLPNLYQRWYNESDKKFDDLEKLLLVLTTQDVKMAKEIAEGNEMLQSILEESLKISKDSAVIDAYNKEYTEKLKRIDNDEK